MGSKQSKRTFLVETELPEDDRLWRQLTTDQILSLGVMPLADAIAGHIMTTSCEAAARIGGPMSSSVATCDTISSEIRDEIMDLARRMFAEKGPRVIPEVPTVRLLERAGFRVCKDGEGAVPVWVYKDCSVSAIIWGTGKVAISIRGLTGSLSIPLNPMGMSSEVLENIVVRLARAFAGEE